MKTTTRFNRLSILSLAGAALALAAFAACTKQEQQKVSASIKDNYEDAKASMAKAWDGVKDFTFEKRSDFDAKAKALAAQMEVQVSQVRANFSEVKASASRKAAMKELKDAQADYQDKLRALGTATADTWESAKQTVILAWNRLQAAYYKARAD
jgi:hypothetical protein